MRVTNNIKSPHQNTGLTPASTAWINAKETRCLIKA